MSNFEFLRNVSIGQYLPIDSPIQQLDPRARILVFTSMILAITAAGRINGIITGIIIAILALILARIPFGYALRSLIPPLPFLFILAVIQVLFNSNAEHPPVLFSFWLLNISLGDLLAGLALILRFAALILFLSLASLCLSTTELTRGLDSLLSPFNRLGLPTHDFIMVILVTLRFVPVLALTAERIAKAQASRGAEWDSPKGGLLARVRQVIPILVPLFLISLRKAENMALALDARGYGIRNWRSSMLVMHFRTKDALFVAAVLILCGFILFI